jgi:hypothetical protein
MTGLTPKAETYSQSRHIAEAGPHGASTDRNLASLALSTSRDLSHIAAGYVHPALLRKAPGAVLRRFVTAITARQSTEH